MKKFGKGFWSILLSGILVLQLGAASAFAEEPESLSGKEPLSISLSLVSPAVSSEDSASEKEEIPVLSDETEVIIPLTEENMQDLFGDDRPQILLDQEVLTLGTDALSLQSLTEHDLSILPPDGFYVSSLTIHGDQEVADPVVLESEAEPGTKQITLKKESFWVDEKTPDFNAALLSSKSENGAYTLAFVLAKLDPEAPIELSYDLNGVEVAMEKTQGEYGVSYTPKSPDASILDSAAEKNLHFDGWKFVYSNGSGFPVKDGESVLPYISGRFIAQWKEAEPKAPEGSISEPETEEPSEKAEAQPTPEPSEKPSEDSPSDSGEEPTVIGDTSDIAELYIEAANESKIYDGKALKLSSCNSDGYTNGYLITGLKEDHAIEGLDSSAEITRPSSKAITIDPESIKVIDTKNDNKEVTDQYKILTKDGTLTITKRSLVITAASAKQKYSGKAVIASEINVDGFTDGYMLSGDGLAKGHSLSAVGVSGEGTDVGNYVTEISDPDEITVSSGQENVTDCYEISTVKGKIAIKARTLTITAISGTADATGNTIYAKNYSGGVYKHGYLAEGLLKGHVLQGDFVTGSGTDKDFKTSIDSSKVQILNEKNQDVTKNYNIKTVDGQMKIRKVVTQTPITITAHAEKEYDATPLTISNKDLVVTEGTLPDNYTLSASFSRSSITDVQSVPVSITKITILDENGKDVTSNYKITIKDGTMVVTKRPLTLTAESASKTYDGKALINKNVKATALASKDHTLSVEYEVTNADGKVIKNGAIEVGTYTKKVSSVTIKEGSKDVTGNYDIKTIDGKLTITAASGKSSGNSSTAKPDTTNPRTGDHNKLNLWVSLLAVSAVLILAVCFIFLRRSKIRKQKS